MHLGHCGTGEIFLFDEMSKIIEKKKLRIWLILAYFQRADGVVIVFDITNEESFKSFSLFGIRGDSYWF